MSGRKSPATSVAKTADENSADADEAAPQQRKRRRLPLFAAAGAVVLLAAAAAGLSFTGIVRLPFLSPPKPKQAVIQQVQFIRMPELVANLDAGPDADSYAKMQAELEVTDAASAAAVNSQMPALIDLFQTYLRGMQPNELRGGVGLYRLRQALLARANIVVAPAAVQNVLFVEMVVQ